MTLWTIYDRPSDYPRYVVVRPWHTIGGEVVPDSSFQCFVTMERARESMEANGRVNVGREPGDDPRIVETWV